MALEVSIIVVNRNSRASTLACLEAVRRKTRKASYELIVADNNSSDGSPSAICAEAADATLIAMDGDLGFAGACNQAARVARGRYLLLLHPDTIILDGAIDRLVRFADCTPDACIWSGCTLNADRTPSTSTCAAHITPWNQFCQVTGLSHLLNSHEVFNGEVYGGWQRDSVRFVDIVASNFLLIEARLWRQLDGFDLSLPMHGEDADLCFRAGHLGAKPLFTPDAETVHNSRTEPKPQARQLTGMLAAKAALARKHWPLGVGWIGHTLLFALPLTRWLAARVANRAEDAEAWAEVIGKHHSWHPRPRRRHVARAWASRSPQRTVEVISAPTAG